MFICVVCFRLNWEYRQLSVSSSSLSSRFSQPWIKNIQKKQNVKKQNLLCSGNYFHSIYIVLGIINNLEIKYIGKNWKLLSHVWLFATPWTVCGPLGSSVHGILQAKILEFAISFSKGPSQPRDWTQVSCIAGRFFTIWATREAQCRDDLKYTGVTCKFYTMPSPLVTLAWRGLACILPMSHSLFQLWFLLPRKSFITSLSNTATSPAPFWLFLSHSFTLFSL